MFHHVNDTLINYIKWWGQVKKVIKNKIFIKANKV